MTPHLNVIEIVVTDMGRSLVFYRRLGLDIPADSDDEPHVEADLPGGIRLAFHTVETIRSFDESWSPPTGGHGLALGFACDGPADVDRSYADLVGTGETAHLPPWDAFWGMRYAVLRDPDGNTVDLFAPLPEQSSWSAAWQSRTHGDICRIDAAERRR